MEFIKKRLLKSVFWKPLSSISCLNQSNSKKKILCFWLDTTHKEMKYCLDLKTRNILFKAMKTVFSRFAKTAGLIESSQKCLLNISMIWRNGATRKGKRVSIILIILSKNDISCIFYKEPRGGSIYGLLGLQPRAPQM